MSNGSKSASHGHFGWYELMTTDAEAAKSFYGGVVGWTATDVGSPEMPYSTFNVNGVGVGGVMKLPPQAGARPGWIGYVVVDDVDASTKEAVSLGGSVHKEPTDVPGMLRFSVVMDPQGAAFILFTPDARMETPASRPEPPTAGTIGWHELMAVDGAAAFGFYGELLGWTKADVHDMGSMGPYQMFAVGGKVVGGIMTKPPEMPAPFWNHYIHVDGADAAVERIKAAGGSVMNGPHEVPGGSWIVQAMDPQGAFFCLVSATR